MEIMEGKVKDFNTCGLSRKTGLLVAMSTVSRPDVKINGPSC
jgi:hypothetical protein